MLHLQRTTAFGHFDDGFVLALERRTDHLGAAAPRHLSRQRVWRIRARRVLVATGAHERPVVFADNDRPGIMLAGGARTFLHRYGVLAGRAAVVFTTDDSAYAAAVDLADAGVEVRAVVDARPEPPAEWRAACASRGIPVRAGQVVTGTDGVERVSAALVAPLRDGVPGESERIDCDLLLVSGGWNPAVHLFSQAGGRLRYDAALGAFVPGDVLARTTRRRGGGRGVRPRGLPRRGPPGGRGRARRPRCRRRCATNDLPAVDGGRGPTHADAGDVAGAGHRRDHPQPSSSSTCSATPRSPTSPARSARACARSSTSSATRRSAPRTTRARPPA